jgi:methylene-tetrahydromethanopterin dehydrogenase
VQGFQAQTIEDVEEVVANADIVLAAGAAGTELLPLAALKKREKKYAIIADINAIPPLGIAGLNSYADGNEVLPGVFGIGALAIGELKNKIEVALIKKASEEPKGTYDYVTAFELAKKSIALKDVGKNPVRVEPQKSWLP